LAVLARNSSSFGKQPEGQRGRTCIGHLGRRIESRPLWLPQILLTTQSADLLADEELDPSQLLVVRNRNGQTHITPVDAASREIVRKELYTLADLQRMDQLELDEADLRRQAGSGSLDGEP
jgi:hypothetical protein